MTWKEAAKLISMSLILFLLLFNHCILWSLKDALVVTTSGAEVVPFIKVWAILPSAILLTLFYTWLSNRFKYEYIFYFITSSFLLLFILFAFVIYPNSDHLHLFESSFFLEQYLPEGFKGLISMYRYWTFTVFYVLCELWNTMVITVLFWGFANAVTQLAQAPRCYGVLSIVSNVALIVAGATSISMLGKGDFNPSIPFGQNAWEQTMMILILLIVISGLVAMGLFRWLIVNVFDDVTALKRTKVKSRLSFRESLAYLGQSKYLISIASVVIGYNLAINLIEVVWKDQLRSLYPAIHDYNNYISTMQMIQGAIALLFSLVMAKLLKYFGWTKIAIITPVLMAISCILFFGMLFLPDYLTTTTMIGLTPLSLSVLFGAVQICIAKGCKTSLFDTTKEMTYIPLDDQSKQKGKAVIDGVGARFGKSSGSMLHQGLLIWLGTISASAPYVMVILLAAFLLWIISIRFLGIKLDNTNVHTANLALA
jgi:AAA family ATP:ADP antiporter